jgi:YbbR domain-containing protein
LNKINDEINLNDNSRLKLYEKLLFKIKDNLFSKSFWGAIVLAIALWMFASLNDTYIINIDFPLKVNLPKDRAFESKLPKLITFRVKGNGWSLFNLLYFNSAKKCNVNLSNYTLNSNELILSRDILLKSVEFIGNTNAQEVYPGKLTLIVGQNIEKQVPIISKIKINPSSQFILVGEPILQPNKITIIGNKKVVEKIENWETEKSEYNGIKNNFITKVKVDEQFDNNIKTKEKFILINQNVEQLTDYEINNVPITFIGNLPRGHQIFPNTINLVIRGGVNTIMNLNIENIYVSLDYKEILDDKTGFIIPNVILPDKVKLIDIKPKYLRHFVVN